MKISNCNQILTQFKRFFRTSVLKFDEFTKGAGTTSIFSSDGAKISNVNIDIVNDSKDAIFFKGYNENGFQLSNGINILGPCAVFPKVILNWNIRHARDINEETLSLFLLLEPKLDVLVIGKGHKSVDIDMRNIFRIAKKAKIGIEILPTDVAISTFNYLNSEERYVAAGLLPVSEIDHWGEEREEVALLRGRKQDILQIDSGFSDPASFDIKLPNLFKPSKSANEILESTLKKTKSGNQNNSTQSNEQDNKPDNKPK